ncbi:hypothetical protein SKAU_G00018320 [Synaphobranchus kaupii]|uniref:Uncharacterized protein n=1 Tax=Synaphobranchus kaupii TaxID=118154 RepID=A0A9Q1GCM1_SYNKA|nr:hypothetical protein SKAU_G00018320 [Synaphobranchus kaupii]
MWLSVSQLSLWRVQLSFRGQRRGRSSHVHAGGWACVTGWQPRLGRGLRGGERLSAPARAFRESARDVHRRVSEQRKLGSELHCSDPA